VARAEAATFEIQSASWIHVVPSTFSNDVVIAGCKILDIYGIKEQSAGSLQTKISGTLNADVTGSTVSFSSSDIHVLANPQAPFLPNIPDSPGVVHNFGAITLKSLDGEEYPNGYIAILDAFTELTTGTAVLGSPPTDIQFTLIDGVMNRDVSDDPHWDYLGPSAPVPNSTTGIFSGSVTGTIHIPFSIKFFYPLVAANDSLLEMDGEIVATRVAAALAGDYNGDNRVNAADYVLWRKGDPRADGSGSNGVGPEDYTIWRNSFNNGTGGTGAGMSTNSAPEPACAALLAIGLLWVVSQRSRSGCV